MVSSLAQRLDLIEVRGVAIVLALIAILGNHFALPAFAESPSSFYSEDPDSYWIQNRYYKARIWKEHDEGREPNGLIKELYIRKPGGGWSHNLVYAGSDFGYALGYVEKRSLSGVGESISDMHVDIKVMDLDGAIVVDAMGEQDFTILGEPANVKMRNLWVFWPDKPYFYGRHEKVYSEYDFGWNDQIAMLHDLAIGDQIPTVYLTNETGGVEVFGGSGDVISRIWLSTLLGKGPKFPYVALKSANIVNSMILLNASSPMVEVMVFNDAPLQETQFTFFSSQDYKKGSLEFPGRTEFADIVYYSAYADVDSVDELARTLFSANYFEEEIPNDIRVGSYYRYHEHDRWTSLYSPYLGYTRSRFRGEEEKFSTDITPQLDYPNYGVAHLMEDHYWAKEWLAIDHKWRFEESGVRSGHYGYKAWTEDYYSLGDLAAVAVRHTLYHDSDKMIVEIRAGVGGGGALFEEDFEEMEPRFHFHGSNYLEVWPGEIRVVRTSEDRGNVLHMKTKALAHTGPLPDSFNATFHVNLTDAEQTKGDFFGIAGLEYLLRLRNDYGVLKTIVGERLETIYDTGRRISSGRWLKFTLSVDATHYSLHLNDEHVGRFAKQSYETPFRLMLSGEGSEAAFDDIHVTLGAKPVSLSELTYYLEYNPALGVDVSQLDATTFDIRFDDPVFGRVGMTVMTKGASSVIDDGSGLSINLLDTPSPVTYTNEVVDATVIIWSHLGEINDVADITPLHTRWPLTIKRHYTTLQLPRIKSWSSITLSKIPSVKITEDVTVSGAIAPNCPGASVTLVYTKPDGLTLTQYVTSNARGHFKAVQEIDQVGDWAVQARWEGDDDHHGAESDVVSFTVLETTTPAATPTLTPTPTPTIKSTPTPTPTPTLASEPTLSPTATPTPIPTPAPTLATPKPTEEIPPPWFSTFPIVGVLGAVLIGMAGLLLWTVWRLRKSAFPEPAKIRRGRELNVILPFVKSLKERGVGFVSSAATSFNIDESEGAVFIYGDSSVSSDREEIIIRGPLMAGEKVMIKKPLRVEGKVIFQNGSIDGYLSSTSDVNILGKTKIDGDLTAGGNVDLAEGSLVRSVRGQGDVIIKPKCTITGDVRCQGNLTISEGVTVKGDAEAQTVVAVQDNCTVKGLLRSHAGDVKIGENCRIGEIDVSAGSLTTGGNCEIGFINAPTGRVDLGDHTRVRVKRVKGEGVSIIHGLGVSGMATIEGKCVVKIPSKERPPEKKPPKEKPRGGTSGRRVMGESKGRRRALSARRPESKDHEITELSSWYIFKQVKLLFTLIGKKRSKRPK